MNGSERFEYIVVGGGIAGLALAEIFARCGHSVALIERHASLCEETSGAHHGWFHFGSLYAIFPHNQFMRTLVGGIDDLLEYYTGFPGMNISVDRTGKLAFRDNEEGWIRDECIQYIVAARNDADFNLRTYEGMRDYMKKLLFTLTWDITIKQFISRHQRFHKFDWRSGPASADVPRAGWFDYSRDVIFKMGDFGLNLAPNTHFQVPGFDRPMRAMKIVRDLALGFLSAGGTLLLSEEFCGYRRMGHETVVTTRNRDIVGKRLILASGRALQRQLAGRMQVSVVASPLMVAYPAVCDVNFVRLTPFMARTVNHIHHRTGPARYSVIGGGYFADPDDERAVEEARSRLFDMATSTFPRLRNACVNKTYVSYKTEVRSEAGERNYQYFIRSVEDGVFVVVPGKFSLGFSTAVNAYKRLVGRNPKRDVSLSGSLDLGHTVGRMRHERIVDEALAIRSGEKKTTISTTNSRAAEARSRG